MGSTRLEPLSIRAILVIFIGPCVDEFEKTILLTVRLCSRPVSRLFRIYRTELETPDPFELPGLMTMARFGLNATRVWLVNDPNFPSARDPRHMAFCPNRSSAENYVAGGAVYVAKRSERSGLSGPSSRGVGVVISVNITD